MKERKYSVGIWAFGNCCDRFCEQGYQEIKTFQRKVELAAKVEGLSGIEIHYNGDFTEANARDVKKLIDDAGLSVAAINCEIFGNREFAKGALISTNQKVRAKAIDIVKKAGEMSQLFNNCLVNLWSGADGFDYAFQINYVQQFDLLADSLNQILTANPAVKYSLEYKIREPRIRSTVGTAGKAAAVINELGKANLGITVDFGHSMMAKENPAEAAAFANRYHKLFHIHLNDNSRDWDDDLITGSYHFWETLEFVYYLKKLGYKGWLGFDMSPAREDQAGAVKYCIEMIEKMFGYVEAINTKELEAALNATDALTAQKFIAARVFR